MKTIIYIILFFMVFSLKGQIAPFTNHDWTIEKIVNSDNSTIIADTNDSGEYDYFIIDYSEFINSFYYMISQCQGVFDFDDVNQAFDILYYGCVISPNHTNIADHFVNMFIVQEGGETITPEGTIYGPFSYDFTYSGDLVYLHITNLAGSVATFYATNLSQEEFLKDAIRIYPNPVAEVLHIDSSIVAIENLSLYDVNGRLVEEFETPNTQVDVSHLQEGVYILEISTTLGVLREKVVKR